MYLLKITHVCEHCGKLHPVYKSELKRGRGVYCCTACRQCHSREKPVRAMCEMCGAVFHTHIGRKTCSLECENDKKEGKAPIF